MVSVRTEKKLFKISYLHVVLFLPRAKLIEQEYTHSLRHQSLLVNVCLKIGLNNANRQLCSSTMQVSNGAMVPMVAENPDLA